MDNTLLQFIIAGVFLAIVILEIIKRIDKKPLALSIAISEKEEQLKALESENKKGKKKFDSFSIRAERVNWKIPRNYQSTMFITFTIIGGLVSFLFDSMLFMLGGVAVGIFYPFLQLRKREEAFEGELPLRAEQAVNAVEQQLHGDIPIFHALKAAVPYMQDPIKREYEKAVEKVEKGGVPLRKAVEEIPARLGLPQLEYFHLILEVAEETEEKAIDIIRDASDVLRRQQKHANRYNQEIQDSKKEMTMMYGLVIVMVLSFVFMLPEQVPFAGSIFHRALDVFVVGGAGWILWVYRKKIQSKNLFG